MDKEENLLKGISEDNGIIQKSIPMLALRNSDLTLNEFKILDTYLARINSHNPEKRKVYFEKKELEKILGVKRILNNVLENNLIHLMKSIVKIPDEEEQRGYKLITLFSEANVKLEVNNVVTGVYLECSEQAMKYIFNIENLKYLRYKLRNVMLIKSRYSYLMFLYLENNRYRKTWEIEVEELKYILNCENEISYKEFKRFNDLVLKKAYKELNEKTECKYTYVPVRKGRKVAVIRFVLETLSDIEIEIDENIPDIDDKEMLWTLALKKDEKCEFTQEQINEIKEVLITIPNKRLPELEENTDINERRYHYISQKYAKLNRVSSETKIHNRFSYFLQMLKKDVKAECEKKTENINIHTKNSFNNFSQRTYDYDALEKELLELNTENE